MSQEDAVLARIQREHEAYLEELFDYLRLPSISADPDSREDVLRCAEFARGMLDSAGLTTEMIETSGYPLVYGEWLGAPGKPTLLIYGHYDVQPPDPLDEWRHPPFEPVVEDGRIVARGATDNKGQHYAHIKAVAATLAETGSLPVNVKFILEGEEESGGEAIEAYVRTPEAAARLACDAVVVSDTSMFGPGVPSLLYGLKGLAYFEIRVQGPNRDLHSGTFGGGVANPANALAHILDSLRDAHSGRILIEGFYDDVRPLEDWERKEFAALPFDEAAWAAELGVPEVFGEEGYSTYERTWARPTCDVNGLWSGYQGKGAKTVLPARAGAKVSTRLVPDQSPERVEELLRAHIARVTPPGVSVEVEFLHGAAPVLVEAQGPLADAAMKAMEQTWGASAVRIREGGSIPIVGTFAEVLEVPVLLVGLGLPDDRLHSPNEKFDLENLHKGYEVGVRLLFRVGEAA